MKYSITNDTVTVVVDGNVFVVHEGTPTYEPLRKALFEGRFYDARKFAAGEEIVEKWSKGNFKVINGVVHYKNDRLPHSLNKRIIDMIVDEADPSALCNFWQKLQRNPSARSVEQLFDFLSHKGIPLSLEGDILAYKSVTADYLDHYTRKISNAIGAVNKLPRNKVSDDPKDPCSFGFHVGSLEYAKSFKATDYRLVICRVDPADVVCVPHDHSSQKMRVCKYEVVSDFVNQLPSTVFIYNQDKFEAEFEDTVFDEECANDHRSRDYDDHDLDADYSNSDLVDDLVDDHDVNYDDEECTNNHHSKDCDVDDDDDRYNDDIDY